MPLALFATVWLIQITGARQRPANQRLPTMLSIPDTVRMSPARVWAVVGPLDQAKKTANLFPFDYVADPVAIEVGLAHLAQERETARRCMFRALRLRDARLVRAFRKDVERANNYIRNGQERLRRIAA
jgi:hypothetical protein